MTGIKIETLSMTTAYSVAGAPDITTRLVTIRPDHAQVTRHPDGSLDVTVHGWQIVGGLDRGYRTNATWLDGPRFPESTGIPRLPDAPQWVQDLAHS